MTTPVQTLARYVNWLSDSYRADPRVLAAIRIGYALWVIVLPTSYVWIAKAPDAFFQPRMGPTVLLSSAPPSAVLWTMQVLQFLLAAVLLVGLRTRLVSVLLSVLMILGSGLVYSYGKVDHFILFELVPIALAAAGWGNAWSLDARLSTPRTRAKDAESSGFPILLWAIVVGYGFLTAALPKAATGWASPFREGTRGYLAREIVDPVRVGEAGKWIFTIDNDLLWKALDYGTLLAEGGLFFVVLLPPLYRLWVTAIIGFHVSVYLTMGISFAPYLFVYLAFFAPWIIWAATRVTARRSQPSPGRRSVPFLAGDEHLLDQQQDARRQRDRHQRTENA